ncbi:cell division protein ZapE [Candidatus Aquarickettsia rohweri]|uniref:Cell division protein ZapE n=1 Tax=Candidatus Aquarickettsia rohweri TaxID=2602574 RepID=A0A3S0AC73_9RICK|nr:cell division protein ZapE [Candidatus Aquarickettsia rohweri]RST71218.1 cell division protein ZapE [Candidatus Aquarickettsia rohweri]
MLKGVYKKYILEKGYEEDKNQLKLIDLLTQFSLQIEKPKTLIDKLFSKNSSLKRGIYLWGKVGRGKILVLNLFFENLQVKNKLKQHFHEFILDCHEKINNLNQQKNIDNKVSEIAKEISKKFCILYLDEFQVNNIVDAMLLSRLFTELINNGMFIFLTSNSCPQDIYKNGLKREYIFPFIDLLLDKIHIFNLDSPQDYRKDKLKEFKLFLYPHQADKFNKLVSNFLDGEVFKKTRIKVSNNRYLSINKCVDKVVKFTFSEICEANLGTTDYIALCNHFSVLVIENIPQLKFENHNEALRFIALIDCMYNEKLLGIFSSEVKLDKLYIGDINKKEFGRTISRIYEMQSKAYIENSKIFQNN